MSRYCWMIVGIVMAVFTGGCAEKKSDAQFFLRENVDLQFYERIAVLPFDNHSTDIYAAGRLRDVTTTHVLANGIFDVIDKGIVDSTLANEAITPGDPIDLPTLKRLGNLLNVKAFLMGTIDQAGQNRKGAFSYPELSLTLRLFDANEGVIIWQASGYGSGYSNTGRLFGVEPRDEFQVATDLVQTLLSSGMGK